MEPSKNLLQHIINENNYIKNNIDVYATLTKREILVISLIMHGFDTEMIAERLGIHTNTVKTYRRNIAEKLAMRDENDLVKFARVFEIV